MDEQNTFNQSPPTLQELLWLTRAYNRKEISYEEWLRLTKVWAETVVRQYGLPDELMPPQTPAAPD
jgi:hypothetical protein